MNISGHRIKVARAMHKPSLSQQDVATKLQIQGYRVSTSLLSKIETGTRGVTDIELKALANVLRVSVDWLVEDTDDPKRRER